MRYLACVFISLALLGLIQGKVVINSTSLSTVRSSVASIQTDHKIFFAGGFELNDYISSNIIDVYNLDNNSWEHSMTLQHPRANLNPVVLGDLIYFIGGHEYTNKPYVYDPSNSIFTQSTTDSPTVRTITDISLHNSILTVVGKWSIDFYDINDGSWNASDTLRNIMASLVNPLVIAAEKYIFMIGGRNSTDQISNSFYVFNIETREISIGATSLEIYQDLNEPAEDNAIFHHFSNNVLVVNKNTTTLLYHVIENQTRHLEQGPVVFAWSTSIATYLFLTSKNAFVKYQWFNDTSLTISNPFVFAFGYEDNVVFLQMDPINNGALRAVLINTQFTLFGSLNNPIDWSGPVSSYFWAPYYHVIAGHNNLLVVDPERFTLTSFTTGEIHKVFVTPKAVFIFAESITTPCLYVMEIFDGSVIMNNDECMPTPDLMFNDTFIYLNDGKGVRWPSLETIRFSPIDTTDLLIAQNEDHLAMMYMTPQIVPNRMIEIYNYTNNGTWLNPIVMPLEFLGDGQNNIVTTSLNDTVLALFNISQFVIYPPNQYSLLENADYSVTGNSFSYNVHSQVAVVVGNDVYMKSQNNSQYLFIFNSESGWRTTTLFPDVAIIEPKQLFVYNNVVYMIAKNIRTLVFDQVYLYDIGSQVWQITKHEAQKATTAAMIGDFLALFADDGKMYSLHMPTGVWLDEDISNTYLFSSVVQVPSDGLTFVSGAKSFIDGRYSDKVLILCDDGTVPTVPQGSVVDPSTQPSSNVDNTTLIVAIVVPVGAVAIGGALLAFFLVQRNKKRKRGATSIIGLETKYGQWFTPFNQIKFGDLLGQGGNGQVFKGTWKNTTVALKVSTAQANSAVIAELELMMQMRPHPNVVQLLGFSIHPETDSIILIIEYCNQGSLDSTLFDNNRPITDEEKFKLIASAAKGLSHLHSNNIVHRDVAARNILVHQNEPKITDFGLSRLVDEDNKKGTTKSELGPIRWMAPEALRSKEYSTKSDVWSFGVLMYEIVAQQEPHSDADPIEVGRLIRDNGLTPVIPEACPTKLASIMKQCWDINPEQRPTIDQILKQLEER